jgi:glycosyltransferase involved in cell wall biosynthesis
MLETAAGYGLTIYDRQAALPNSPYQFPPEFQVYSEGSLPYDEVIDSYKAHLAHLNGNSVMNSPTMFSRRVVEIAACGGIALSGPGRGVEETFGGMIPASRDAATWRALLHSWATDPVARVREAWRQMRAVHRSHTVLTAMTLLLRTAGIPVRAPRTPSYAVVLTEHCPELIDSVLGQSLRPSEVFIAGGPSDLTRPLEDAGIAVRDSAEVQSADSDWIGLVSEARPRTWFEDLLIAVRFGDWDRIAAELADESSTGRTLASAGIPEETTSGLVATHVARRTSTVEDALRARADAAVTLLVAAPMDLEGLVPSRREIALSTRPLDARTVLVAGHDLKFARPILAALEQAGHTVLIDQWDNHTQHDEERSLELLAQADVVLCEWGLGNAVWYSRHLRSTQRLVVRVHSQELFRPYLSRVKHEAVDGYVFVGELIRRAAVESHGVPAAKTHIIPNFVDAEALDLPKIENSSKHLGFVGIVPRAKRMDLAVDVLTRLLEQDPEYKLFIKGRQPQDYPWMAQRPDEMEWYQRQYARIEEINAAFPGAVVFDPQGDDMPEWYRKIGIALSTSDFESFHLTIADGAASRALPVSLAWPGSDFIYPREWLAATVDGIVESVRARESQVRDERQTAVEQFATTTTMPALLEIIAPTRA